MSAPALDSARVQVLRAVAIDCLRSPDDERAAERARTALSESNFDWPIFQAFAHQQRISPLLHYYLGDFGLLPPEVAESFQRAYLQTAWDNAQRLEELYALLDRFETAGLPVTLLKGTALIHSIYDKAALRPMCDMDLLFYPKDAYHAHDILISCDYIPAPHILHKELEIELAYHKQNAPSSMIELHSSLYNPPHTPILAQLEWFFNHRTAYHKDSHTIWTFEPTAQLLQLSAHLWLHHEGSDLLGLYDIYHHVSIYFNQIDWEQVLNIGHDFELLMPLQQVLPELSGSWGIPIPSLILKRLTTLQPSLRERRKFGKHADHDQNYFSVLPNHIFSFPDWPSRLRYLWSISFPSPEFIRYKYNARGLFQLVFFYFYRLGSRIIQQTKQVLGKLRASKTS